MYRRKYASRKSAYRRVVAPRKYGKKYNRRRFTKKRYAKNNVNQLTMRAPLASRLLRVKLPWVKTFSHNFTASSSQSWVFQGNGIVPYTSAGQSGITSNNPGPGDSLPAGEIEYSNLYDKYFINGSSIKVEVVNTANTPAGTIRFVLLAIPFGSGISASPVLDNWPSVRDQLNSYTYEQLLAWPYAKWRMLGSNLGGSSRLLVKMFRKTKHMCGIKDLRDNVEYRGALTDGLSAFAINQAINPGNGFMYYIKMFNTSGSNTPNIDMTVRMSLYVTMTNREFNPVVTITNP